MTKKISLQKKKLPSKIIYTVQKNGKLKLIKTDKVCYDDYAIPGKYIFKKKE